MLPKLPGIVAVAPRSVRAADKEPLQVRIPALIKRRFKAHAASLGLEPNELFVEIWAYYEGAVINKSQNQKAKNDG